jgi:hypothetical protein
MDRSEFIKMSYSEKDREILRELGRQIARIGSMSINEQRKELYRKIDNLEKTKPIVHIYEVPWHEMDVNDELNLRTKDPFCQGIEVDLRRTLYQWRHMQGDMVVESMIEQPLCVHDTGFGITEEVDIARTDVKSDIVSRNFHVQIKDEGDIEKIKMPEVTFDKERTEKEYQMRCEIFEGILPVEKRGLPIDKRGSERCFWFAPWDDIVRWTGIKEILIDMYRRPEYVHKIVERMVDAWLYRLDQYEHLGLLQASPMKLWGVGAAQIFVAASPAMHEEFALKHETRWYERFGNNFYGCCEPLHNKIDIIKRNIPRLRKISISPFADFDKAVENVRDEIVFAWKPSPAIFAASIWDPKEVRKDMKEKLKKAKNCVIEIHMKDISTVKYQPQRLWEWAQIAAEVTNNYAP